MFSDSFGEDWMETVDFKTLLDSNATVPAPKPVAPVSVREEQEPRKEGMKAAAFELLKALLTGDHVKTDLTLTLNEPSPATTPPVMSPVAEVPNLDLPTTPPVAEVSNLDFTGNLDSSVNFDMLLDDSSNHVNPFESFIQPELALDNGDVAEIEPISDGPLIASIELLDTVSKESQLNITPDSIYVNYSSPVSSDETDSFSVLSSQPSSPLLSTVDTNQFNEDSDYAVSSVKGSQVSEQDFTKLKTSKSKGSKARVSPYDSDYDNIHDKKIRKKMQNKNAATRYRVKKRIEKESLQEQEVRLSDKNKELKEKVESLQREIKYMKELMNEINKAKLRKI